MKIYDVIDFDRAPNLNVGELYWLKHKDDNRGYLGVWDMEVIHNVELVKIKPVLVQAEVKDPCLFLEAKLVKKVPWFKHDVVFYTFLCMHLNKGIPFIGGVSDIDDINRILPVPKLGNYYANL